MDGTKKKRIRNWVVGVAALCFAGWLGLVGYVNWAMHQPPEVFGHVMAKMPMPAYFRASFRNPLDAGSSWAVERGGRCARPDGEEA